MFFLYVGLVLLTSNINVIKGVHVSIIRHEFIVITLLNELQASGSQEREERDSIEGIVEATDVPSTAYASKKKRKGGRR